MYYAPHRVTDTPRPDRVALSREYSDFLIELSISLHKYGMYPIGHPSLEPAAQSVATRAAHLLVDRAQVAFGVARRQLIIEGVATNPAQPVLRRLAEGLHRHHLGAVTLLRGVDATEIGEALRALALEPEQHGPIGLGRVDARLAWPHLRLHPLSFDGLTLASDAPTTGVEGAGGGLKGAELWIGLARAAMAGQADSASDAADIEPDVIARAIDDHAGVAAYDQVIIGYLLQIARELKTSNGAATIALQRRTARLIGALSPQTLRRLVDMGGDAAQRRAFVLDASQSMAVDAVIDIVKAAADASGQTISHGLVRMLSKLAAHAEFGVAEARPLADVALREQVGELLNGWRLADPNPEAYSAVLQELATGVAPRTAGDDLPPMAAEETDPVRLVQMSLEIGDAGPMVERAIVAAIARGRAADLIALLADGPDHAGAAADRIRASLIRPEALRTFFEQAAVDFDSLDRLQPLMTAASYDVLLDMLATADNRTTRRKLLDRLTQAPVDLGPTIVARLEDPRWFVQRNMLVLLERFGRVPEGLSLTRWVSHPDIRVRQEAIRLQLALPAERHSAVRAALDDGHPRLVHAGLVAIQQSCPGSLADKVGSLALDAGAAEELRLLAIRALSRCRDPRALTALLELTHGGRSILGRTKLAARSPVVLAALQGLAGGWRSDGRAAIILKLAAESSDPEIQRAAGQGGR